MAFSASFSPLGNKDQGGDEWKAVIKVKYGDTLKRFSARVHRRAYLGKQQTIIEYDMNQLRAKISSIFNFSHDAALILTYTDEDGDIVSLDSDEELHDAVISQRLNPLKINVQIKPYPTGGSHSSSIPAESSDIGSVSDGFPQLSTKLNSALDKSLKSLPEPLRGPLSNISHDVLQIASSALTAPGFSDILSLLSKVQLVQLSNSPIHKSTGMSTGVPSSEVDLNTGDEPKVSNNSENQSPTVVPCPNSVSTVTENIQKMRESGHLNEPLGSINLTSDDLDLRIGKSAVAEVPPSTLFGTHSSNPIDGVSNTFPFAATLECPFSVTPLDFPTYQGDVLGNSGASPTAVPRPFIPLPIASSGSQSDASGSRSGLPTLFSHPPMLMHPYGRPPTCLFHMPRTFHQGVICDGCGMHPILGPRYKSTVKENYDLCATCFRDIGTETEYTRIDSSFRFPKSKDHQKHHHRSRAFSKIMSHNRMKVRAPKGPKLESSFVVDVTVWDGTFVRPNSRFTKIWRMRNTGTIAWPSGTRLVWVGGDCLGIYTAAELEIPAMGFPVDYELDIAVDCVAPSVLGQYISYWQMVSPFGQNFGEEVWIIVQVCDVQAASSGSIPPTSLNQNLPPESGPVVVDVDAKPLGFSPSTAYESLGEVLKPGAPYLSNLLPADVTPVPQPADNISAPFLTEEIPASSSPDSNPSTVDIEAALSPILYPLVDISALPNSLDIDYAPSDALTNENMVEVILLKELEEMGFMQTDLNKDILRQNRYDLEQSVEELCEFAEWDPLLKELQEMGFNDRELNRKLLSKNAGSLKRVVFELVKGEKTN